MRKPFTKQCPLLLLLLTVVAVVVSLTTPCWAVDQTESNIEAGQAFSPSDSKIVINVPARKLTLFFHGLPVKQYPVGVGRLNFPTPKGQYKVLRKIIDPGWENPYKASSPNTRIAPGKGNPLGTRWIGFKEDAGGEYGIHGTNRPQSVGQFSSHGCVRMKIPDVEEIFEHVTVDTPVEISYQPIEYSIQGNDLKMKRIASPFKQSTAELNNLTSDLKRFFPHFTIEPTKVASLVHTPANQSLIVGSLNTVMQQRLDRAVAHKAPLPGDEELLEALDDTSFQDIITSNYF